MTALLLSLSPQSSCSKAGLLPGAFWGSKWRGPHRDKTETITELLLLQGQTSVVTPTVQAQVLVRDGGGMGSSQAGFSSFLSSDGQDSSLAAAPSLSQDPHPSLRAQVCKDVSPAAILEAWMRPPLLQLVRCSYLGYFHPTAQLSALPKT